jgi:16S rRNA (adenine1518-N6/adenine1519-N6)-dimethyltransferase
MIFDTKELMRKYNIRPTKSLGQNFLIDENIVDRIIETAEITKEDLIIEIGPGLGAMTTKLAESAGFVAAVELDTKLLPVLRSRLNEYPNVFILNKDILKVDIKKDILESDSLKAASFEPSSIKLVANLPYYITTPIVMGMLEQELDIDLMIFMVQKEVAERMVAMPGGKDYGALSVAVQFYSAAQKVFDVSPRCFIPVPKVYSSVVKLDIYKNPIVDILSKEVFFKVVKAAFGQRRKTLLNALNNSGFFCMDKETIQNVLNELGILEKQRGETLSLDDFAEISNKFYAIITSASGKL